MSTITLKTEFNRRFPDPLNKLDDDNSLNIEHHVVLCRAVDLPPGIPKDPNPRAQNTDKAVYKEVKQSLLTEADPTFHLKNKGITIIAHQVNYTPSRDAVEIHFKQGEGIVDGAHTYEIIQENKENCPSNQFVKLEILTGIPRYFVEPIAQGLNTAVQVQKMSLAELEGKYDWIKEILDRTPYAKEIAYKENVENAEYDIRDIIGLMTLFNTELYPDGSSHPKVAYVSKAKALEDYLKKQTSFEKLAPILKDILELHDYVQLKWRELYNEKYKGKGGKLAFCQTRKKGYRLVFTNKQTLYMLYEGALFPILGAFRYLVGPKPGNGHLYWKVGSFEEVKKIFDKVGADMVNSTKGKSDSTGRNPNAIGKDDGHWENLYKTVALSYFENNRAKN